MFVEREELKVDKKTDMSDTDEHGEKAKEARAAAGSLRMVLREADWKDMLLMMLGTIGCAADGAALALFMIVLSKLMDSYAAAAAGGASFSLEVINKYALDLTYVAVGVGLGAFLEGFCWARTAERQTSRLGRKYLEAVLRQDVGFYDINHGTTMTSQVVSSISNDMLTIQGVLTEKMANFITNISTFITAQMAAAYLSWRLAILGVPVLSLLIIPGIVYGKLLAEIAEKMQQSYTIAGGIVEQTLSSIRTVYSYVGEDRMVNSYKTALEPTLKLGIKQGLFKGMAMGSIGVTFAVWALQSWYGSTLVTKKGAKGGDVFNAGVCIIFGGLSLGSALINIKYFAEANVATSRIFEMIQRVPNIDSANQQGKMMSNVKGDLEFKNIQFAYPSRPGSLVLQRFNLIVKACQTVGLVGRSGSGKSTIVNLIERFYDPLRGEILLDGINIKEFQLRWLRSQIGLVSQETILFRTSIKENIQFGKEEATMEEIIRAAKAADAHNFISQLPDGYDTLVGTMGIQMSEGQKQRISIARALLRDPRILLLDEATSALDLRSEKAVQDALNHASEGRTTVIIAHRISALRNANLIAFIQAGQVVESGSHDQLMQKKNGLYSAMVQLQRTLINNEATSTSGATELISVSENEAGSIYETGDNLVPACSIQEKGIVLSQEDQKDATSTKQLLKMTAPEWKSTLIGFIGALFYGLIQPLHSFCLGALLSVYFMDNHDEIRQQTKTYCFAFLSFAIFTLITNVIQHYSFGIVGECLTKRVREAVFGKIVTFEMEWFDKESNSTGALCSRLATDATMVRTLVTDRLSFLTQSISATTLAIILGMLLSWKLALVAIAMQPLLIGSFYTKAIAMKSMSKKILKAQNKSSDLASEAVGNHRMITAFYSQKKVLELYESAQMNPKKESHKQSWIAGFGLFISQFLTIANPALMFWYGGKLLYHGNISYKHLFQTFFILTTTGRVIAETGSTTLDLTKGRAALNSTFMILKRKSRIDPDDVDGIKPEKIVGDIEFKHVEFYYPTRPKQIVLKDLSLRIDAGKVVALVGQSGSGKSTVIRLIERFYEPWGGSVEVDGIDIKSYNLQALRSHIALVSQEPTIFAGTIHDNIAYAKQNATDAEIIEAATIANAHDFISSMKDGYATCCGERGTQLSGGQKQRIALARAILKNPAILLLDEATSALDVNSENLIQEALEKMMVGRACLVVAHRLSTIQKSDKISVIDNGKVIEEGTHSELLQKGEKSAYFNLVKLQQLVAM